MPEEIRDIWVHDYIPYPSSPSVFRAFIQSLYLPAEPPVKAREAGAHSLLFPCLS
jgi:hypothetical protein